MGRLREAMARMVGGSKVTLALEQAKVTEAWSPMHGPGGSRGRAGDQTMLNPGP